MRLESKTALVTGAAQGIGLAIATAFVSQGANVFGIDINGDTLEQSFGTLARDAPKRVAYMTGDVTDEAVVESACAAAVEQFGNLNVLVCNAATLTPSCTVEELSTKDWNAALAVNLTSAFYTCKHGIGRLRNSGGGSIVIVASQMGSVAWTGSAAYCATKGALIQFAKALSLDHAKENIRVNTLSPGGTATHRLERKYGDAQTAEREWGPMHPIGRLGRVEEIARGAAFLASDDSSFMTGADLLMDGGYTAW
jgi:NAD(P)-dependent dehydrogenase (short-subunit alcohol dehydrogenase family)